MAVYANLFVDQGTDFMSTINLEGGTGAAFNIADFEIRAQMRKSYSSSKAIDFVANIIDPTNGIAQIELSAEVTSTIKPGRYVYDVEVISPDTVVYRVVEGQIEVSPRVTRPYSTPVSTALVLDGGTSNTEYRNLVNVLDGGNSQ